ncbi:hypothetical protein ACWKWP_04325 [Agromyces soli]
MTQIAVIGVAAALLLTGCTATLPEKNRQTPEQTHEAVREAMESTIEALGGPDGWTEFEDNSANECEVGGFEGVEYAEGRSRPVGYSSIADRESTVKLVRKHLESLGMQTWIAEKTAADPMVIVDAKNGPTEKFSVYIGPEHIAISGHSWCVPGDWQELLHQQQDQPGE